MVPVGSVTVTNSPRFMASYEKPSKVVMWGSPLDSAVLLGVPPAQYWSGFHGLAWRTSLVGSAFAANESTIGGRSGVRFISGDVPGGHSHPAASTQNQVSRPSDRVTVEPLAMVSR